jgi:hypothetical protein
MSFSTEKVGLYLCVEPKKVVYLGDRLPYQVGEQQGRFGRMFERAAIPFFGSLEQTLFLSRHLQEIHGLGLSARSEERRTS